MKKKLSIFAVCTTLFITGCGGTTEDSGTKTLKCTEIDDAIKKENVVTIEFAEDLIVKSDMMFSYGEDSEQSYIDTVCESYEMIEGLTCEGKVEEGTSIYEITTNTSEATLSILEIRESVMGETYEELEESFEKNNYTCE